MSKRQTLRRTLFISIPRHPAKAFRCEVFSMLNQPLVTLCLTICSWLLLLLVCKSWQTFQSWKQTKLLEKAHEQLSTVVMCRPRLNPSDQPGGTFGLYNVHSVLHRKCWAKVLFCKGKHNAVLEGPKLNLSATL